MIWVFRPFQNYFTYIEPMDKQRGAPDLSLAEPGIFMEGWGAGNLDHISSLIHKNTDH